MPRIANPTGHESEKDIGKVVLFCTSFGAVFGIIASLTFFLFGLIPLRPFEFILITFSSALISGGAGLLSIVFNWALLKLGLTGDLKRQILTYIILAVVTLGGSAILVAGFEPLNQQRPFLWGGILGCILGGIVTVVYVKIWKYQQKVSTLEKENILLAEIAQRDRALKDQAEKIAVADERTRIARDLHDSVCQGIHGLVYLIHSLRKFLDDNKMALEITDHLEKTAEATLSELRAMIMELKPSLLSEHGLTEAITTHADLFAKRANIKVDLHVEEIPGLSPGQETAIYRITQEALSNIQKHAQARNVSISLLKKDGLAVLAVCDDGIGIAQTNTKESGLANMAARCRENKGNFQILSKTGQGTRIVAEFHLEKQEVVG